MLQYYLHIIQCVRSSERDTGGALSNDDGNGNDNAAKQEVSLMRKGNRSARAFYILHWYISLPSSAKQQREMTTFFIFFLNLNAIPTNLVPG